MFLRFDHEQKLRRSAIRADLPADVEASAITGGYARRLGLARCFTRRWPSGRLLRIGLAYNWLEEEGSRIRGDRVPSGCIAFQGQ